MSKKFGLMSEKRTLIASIIGIIILLAGAGTIYYFYTQNQKQQVQKIEQQKKVVESERQKLDDIAFRGDRDLAAEYIAKVQGGQQESAYAVYEQAMSKLTDNTAKIALYNQAVSISYRAKQTDHAIKYAISASDIANNYRASSNVADLYGLTKDYENQKKYLQKALEQIEVLPKDSLEYTQMKPYYQDKLSQVGSN